MKLLDQCEDFQFKSFQNNGENFKEKSKFQSTVSFDSSGYNSNDVKIKNKGKKGVVVASEECFLTKSRNKKIKLNS